MTKESERMFLLECIKLYRELPALWKVKSPEYNNRVKKNDAYDTLVTKFQEKYPDITREEVKKKFNSLRTNFRKEVKKVFDSKKPGAEEVYIPTLWYYDEMLFLIDHEMSTQTISFMEENDENDSESDSCISRIKKPILLKKKTKFEENDDTVLLPYKRLRESEDEFDKLGAAWACELRKMDPVQQLFAKKAINDVLFEGQLGTLNRNSVIINSPSAMLHSNFTYTNTVPHHST